ncbi:MAG TPA: hypothetical protein VGR71_11885 [Nitrospira sp.]|nr:hypothetical protein [Nitrospira sp.]
MAVRDAISSYSRGELAPAPNTFVQPGTYKDNPDTAMTDGVKHAMLKAQRETQSALKKPGHVKRHLHRHHGIENAANPVAVHARQHTVGVMNQGHSFRGGQLFHGSTDIGAGTSNFAAEAPPLVSLVELIRHVRTPEGAAFYRKSIGTPLIGDPEQTYASQKAKNAAAQQAEDTAKAEKKVTSHSDLLAARRDARAKYGVGHPLRLAAERAVRSSRRTSGYRDAKGGQAHVSTAKKSADMRKDPGYISPKDVTSTKTAKTTPATSEPVPLREQAATRLAEVERLSAGERSRYFAMRNAGIQHPRAMSRITQQRAQARASGTVVTKLKQRRARG